jgi:hypothetical protein
LGRPGAGRLATRRRHVGDAARLRIALEEIAESFELINPEKR